MRTDLWPRKHSDRSLAMAARVYSSEQFFRLTLDACVGSNSTLMAYEYYMTDGVALNLK